MTARRDDKMMARLREAFLQHGYERPTMIALAEACELTRRALYHHFSSKEEAFREVIRWRHGVEIDLGLAAGRRRSAEGGSAIDAVVAIFDARYGEARRDLERSPHALELNHEAFRRCRDVMSESAAHFQARLAEFLRECGRLRLRPGFSFAEAAQLLADGVRGVNQTLPARSSSTLPERYRRMCEALLYGFAETPGS
jgi:AcrR family transcriptional regulator